MKLLLKSKNSEYLVDSAQKEFHCREGMVKLATPGKSVKSNTAVMFSIVKANFLDCLKRSKRGPQVVLPKDVGYVLANAGVDKSSIVIDAGSGSGWFACHASRFVKKVYSYELRKDFYELAKSNAKSLGVKNVVFKNKDASKGFDEVADLVFLDMLNPEQVPFEKSLKLGGYCVAYVPHIEQATKFCEALGKKMAVEKIVDLEEKLFDKKGKERRNIIKHTAFLVFARKIK